MTRLIKQFEHHGRVTSLEWVVDSRNKDGGYYHIGLYQRTVNDGLREIGGNVYGDKSKATRGFYYYKKRMEV